MAQEQNGIWTLYSVVFSISSKVQITFFQKKKGDTPVSVSAGKQITSTEVLEASDLKIRCIIEIQNKKYLNRKRVKVKHFTHAHDTLYHI